MKKILFAHIFIAMLLIAAGVASGASAQEAPSRPEEGMLSLEDCVLFALGNSFDVKVAKLDLLIAETDILYSQAVFDTIIFGEVSYNESKVQQLSVFSPDDNQVNIYSGGLQKTLPTGTELKASYSDTRSWNNSAFVSKNPAHESVYTLEAVQPVGKNFFGYVDRNTITITKLAVKNADLDTKDRIEKLIAEVERAYWRLAFAKRSLEITEDMLEKAQKLYEQNEKNYDVGLIEKVDFLASQANVITRKTGVLLAMNDYRNSREDLKLVMNLKDYVPLAPEETIERRDFKGSLAESLKEAFEKRRDYMADKRDVQINNITLKIKNNEKWPEIDLKASLAANGLDPKLEQAFATMTSGENAEMYAGVEFSWPIENSAARSEAKKAKYEKEKAILLMKQTERRIITEVGNTYRDVETSYARSGNESETVKLQGEKLSEEEKMFRHGRSDTKTLIDYQHDLLIARMREAESLLRLKDARVGFERSTNSILEKYEEKL